MNLKIRFELSLMMFIQFFIWGAWAVTMGAYLGKIGFTGADIGSAYSTGAIAAIVAPFFVGIIADRFFSAERVLGVMHLLGAGFMYWASTITTPGAFFWVMLGYMICYMPTLALVNAVAFYQMKDPQTEFPSVRFLGTLGWIVVGFFLSKLKIEQTAIPLQIAAVASVVMGVYSFFLPHTPPKSRGKKVSVSDVLGLDALKLMKERSFAVFVISSILICIPLAFYYSFANFYFNELKWEDAAFKMTYGQMSEVIFMLVIPFFFRRLGVKKMLLVGMLAWAIRYTFFAFGNVDSLSWMFFIGILLHGVCYDFFFVTGQIYTDKKAPVEIQASAQGFIALITYGVGMWIGNLISGQVVDHFVTQKDAAGVAIAHNWQAIWLIPGGLAVFAVLFFLFLFNDKSVNGQQA